MYHWVLMSTKGFMGLLVHAYDYYDILMVLRISIVLLPCWIMQDNKLIVYAENTPQNMGNQL